MFIQIAKFGGTSLANAETMEQVFKIVRGKLKDENTQLALVLSAMGGVTSQLQNLAFLSYGCAKDSNIQRCEKLGKELEPLSERHLETAEALLSPAMYHRYKELASGIFINISIVLETIALQNDLSGEMLDLLLPQGELLSSHLFAMYLEDQGIDCAWFDSRKFIISRKHSDRTNVDLLACRANCELERSHFGRVNIFPGFIASTPRGRTTVLGRNGSDYSATILAYGLQADMVEIWTDVDGILTTDPRIVPEAFIIPEMSVEEAMEMAYFGAKVIHAQTLLPIMQHNCPVRICNTFKPEGLGTIIRVHPQKNKRLLTAISYVDDASLLLLDGLFLNSAAFLARVFRAFEQHKIEPIIVIRVTSDNKLCLSVYKNQIATAISAISSEFERELHSGDFAAPQEESDISIISVIGEQMRGKIGTIGGIFSGLAELGINILALGQDLTENNISFIIKKKDQIKTIRYLHQNYLSKAIE